MNESEHRSENPRTQLTLTRSNQSTSERIRPHRLPAVSGGCGAILCRDRPHFHPPQISFVGSRPTAVRESRNDFSRLAVLPQYAPGDSVARMWANTDAQTPSTHLDSTTCSTADWHALCTIHNRERETEFRILPASRRDKLQVFATCGNSPAEKGR